MLALMDDTEVSPLILCEDEYSLLRNILIWTVDVINEMQKTVVNVENQWSRETEPLALVDALGRRINRAALEPPPPEETIS
jgi:hypothetical protein